jgi:TrpR-related protein YerC/YecD
MEQNFFERFSDLFEAVVKLESKQDCERFFEDICTIKEMEDMTQRLQVASLLRAGKNYREISEETGASTATISRVNRCLHYGSGGYALVLEKKGE